MDRNPQCIPLWWVILPLCTLADGLLVYTDTYVPPSRTHGNIQPPPAAFEQQQNAEPHARTRPVVVNCYPDSMELVVQADLFDRGIRVEAKHLSLGSDAESEGGVCRPAPSGEAEFTVWALLTDCGTHLSVSILLVKNLVNVVETCCLLSRRYAVGGISLKPTWIPSVSMASAEDQLEFNLMLMTADWRFQRSSYSYFLGDPINFEVSVVIRNHMPLRVYVDHCGATADPDAEAPLRYDFIEHFGCLTDTYLTNSSSHFLPRVEEHKLRFQLDAFRFHQETSSQVYITCSVKAVPVTLTVSSQNRACSLIENRWRSVDGNEQACRSCDISHQAAEPLSSESSETATGTKAQPIMKPQQSFPASPLYFQLGLQQSQHRNPLSAQQSSTGLMKRGAQYTAQGAVQLGPITVLPSSKTTTRARDSEAAPKST
uniref:Zona pellucida sperm-binding protein 3 n=1 Tax=Mola mola TaxID=94237 RepID=A0A3Q4BTN1_MOLML